MTVTAKTRAYSIPVKLYARFPADYVFKLKKLNALLANIPTMHPHVIHDEAL